MVILYIQIQYIRRKSSEFRSRLNVYFEKASKPDKALLVCTTNKNVKIFHRLTNGNPFLHRRFIINLQFVLWIIGREKSKQTCQLFPLSHIFNKLLIDFIKIVIVGFGVFI